MKNNYTSIYANEVDIKKYLLIIYKYKKIFSLIFLIWILLGIFVSKYQSRMKYGEAQLFLENSNFIYKGNKFKNSINFTTPKEFLREKFEKPELFQEVFEYAKYQNRMKGDFTLEKVSISKWIEHYFDFKLEANRPVLDITFRDQNEEIIIPVIEKLGKKYNDYYNEFKINSLKKEINALEAILPDLSSLDNEKFFNEDESPENSIRYGKLLALRTYEKEFKNYQTLLMRELDYIDENWIFVVDPEITEYQVNNKIKTTLAIALIAGIFSGIFISLILETFDKKIYTKDDVFHLVPASSLIELNISDLKLLKEILFIMANGKLKKLGNKIGIIELGNKDSDNLKKVSTELKNLMPDEIVFINDYEKIFDVENIIISIEKTFAREKDLLKAYEYIQLANKKIYSIFWV